MALHKVDIGEHSEWKYNPSAYIQEYSLWIDDCELRTRFDGDPRSHRDIFLQQALQFHRAHKPRQ